MYRVIGWREEVASGWGEGGRWKVSCLCGCCFSRHGDVCGVNGSRRKRHLQLPTCLELCNDFCITLISTRGERVQVELELLSRPYPEQRELTGALMLVKTYAREGSRYVTVPFAYLERIVRIASIFNV